MFNRNRIWTMLSKILLILVDERKASEFNERILMCFLKSVLLFSSSKLSYKKRSIDANKGDLSVKITSH